MVTTMPTRGSSQRLNATIVQPTEARAKHHFSSEADREGDGSEDVDCGESVRA